MRDIRSSIRRREGLAATFELRADGHTRGGLSAAVRGGRIIRVRQGWYSLPETHPTLRAAARVGGRAGCATGLALRGCWTGPVDGIHVTVAPGECRLRRPDDMRRHLTEHPTSQVEVHWSDTGAGGTRLIASVDACIADLLRCQPLERAFPIIDSAVRELPDLAARWPRVLATLPVGARGALALADGVCESGTESEFWLRMQRFRLPIIRQRPIVGIGRVDFAIGRGLVVEIDGAAYHLDRDQFERDRHRDAVLSRRGYRVLRFSYRQVVAGWQEVEDAVLGAIIRGDHL